jgi:tripartite-type tricarboxylate transporter receptor subunit TctC
VKPNIAMPAIPRHQDLSESIVLGFISFSPTYVPGTGRGFAMPAAVPKQAAATMEGILRKLHQTKVWKDFAARNRYEEKYLTATELTEYMQKRLVEQREFLAAIGTLKTP